MRILESRYPVEDWSRGMTSFEVLISTILSQSTTVAHERRGVNDLGPQTAGVVRVTAAGHPTFPVVSRIARIARGLNLVRRTDYETTRAALERWTPPGKRKAWHLAIIAHGRALCKARNPRCGECPVRRDCDWYRRRRTRAQRSRRGTSPRATKD